MLFNVNVICFGETVLLRKITQRLRGTTQILRRILGTQYQDLNSEVTNQGIINNVNK